MKLRQQLGRIHIQLRGKNKIVGWGMTPDKAQTFFKSMGKKVVTSGIHPSMKTKRKC
jgi:hypothetical protein